MRKPWYSRNRIFLPITKDTDSDNAFQQSSAQIPIERRTHIRRAIFRGDPREFLG